MEKKCDLTKHHPPAMRWYLGILALLIVTVAARPRPFRGEATLVCYAPLGNMADIGPLPGAAMFGAEWPAVLTALALPSDPKADLSRTWRRGAADSSLELELMADLACARMMYVADGDAYATSLTVM